MSLLKKVGQSLTKACLKTRLYYLTCKISAEQQTWKQVLRSCGPAVLKRADQNLIVAIRDEGTWWNKEAARDYIGFQQEMRGLLYDQWGKKKDEKASRRRMVCTRRALRRRLDAPVS